MNMPANIAVQPEHEAQPRAGCAESRLEDLTRRSGAKPCCWFARAAFRTSRQPKICNWRGRNDQEPDCPGDATIWSHCSTPTVFQSRTRPSGVRGEPGYAPSSNQTNASPLHSDPLWHEMNTKRSSSRCSIPAARKPANIVRSPSFVGFIPMLTDSTLQPTPARHPCKAGEHAAMRAGFTKALPHFAAIGRCAHACRQQTNRTGVSLVASSLVPHSAPWARLWFLVTATIRATRASALSHSRGSRVCVELAIARTRRTFARCVRWRRYELFVPRLLWGWGKVFAILLFIGFCNQGFRPLTRATNCCWSGRFATRLSVYCRRTRSRFIARFVTGNKTRRVARTHVDRWVSKSELLANSPLRLDADSSLGLPSSVFFPLYRRRFPRALHLPHLEALRNLPAYVRRNSIDVRPTSALPPSE